MPRARTKRGRLQQIARWLAEAHPAPYPVTLRFVKLSPPGKAIDTYGDCVLDQGRFTIRIEPRLRWRTATEVLLHEWAHARAWPHRRLEAHTPDHGSTWGVEYAALYEAFYDELGDEAADAY